MQVRKVKEKIAASKGADNFPVEGQKLIYCGRLKFIFSVKTPFSFRESH